MSAVNRMEQREVGRTNQKGQAGAGEGTLCTHVGEREGKVITQLHGWPLLLSVLHTPLDPGQVPDSQDGSAPASQSLTGHLSLQAQHLPQAWLWQWTEGTHRLDEPVSKRTRKFCGGVPMLISPR